MILVFIVLFYLNCSYLCWNKEMIMKGTKFQIKVWKYLKTIPKGKVKTYKQVAIGINSPKAPKKGRFFALKASKIKVFCSITPIVPIYL